MLEQNVGIEPTSSAWKAEVLPIYEFCIYIVEVVKSKNSFIFLTIPQQYFFSFIIYYIKNLRKNQIKWSVLPESNRAIVICSHSSNRLIQHA